MYCLSGYWSNSTTISDLQDITAQDKQCLTPLHLASQNDHTEFTSFLVKHRGRPSSPGQELINSDLIVCGVKSGNPQIAHWLRLVDVRCSPTARLPIAQDKMGSSPLHLSGIVSTSVPTDNGQFVELLGEHKSLKKEGMYKYGVTRQELASLGGNVKITRLLVERGTGVTAQAEDSLAFSVAKWELNIPQMGIGHMRLAFKASGIEPVPLAFEAGVMATLS